MDAGITIIGAGVIGLAISERLSGTRQSVFLIEKHSSFGKETSSRNSEVIHAGIYYEPGSLKARLCTEGNRLLYEYCDKFNIPYRRCGKLIVATDSEESDVLSGIMNNAARNGVRLEMLDGSEVSCMEPNVFALKALFSPATGILDTHSLMKRLEINTLNNGGEVVYGSEVTGIRKIEDGYDITLLDSDKRAYSFTSSVVINSAGLFSDKISGMAGMKDENLTIQFCKGEYFRVKPPKNRLISRLVYPVPFHNLDGVGIHATIDISGGVKLGPDVTYLDSNVDDYSVDPSKKESFLHSARKYLPFLEPGDIVPEMAGIRPKIQKKGEPARDFYIREESARGFPGFINLIGIESPGLTSCLAIGEMVSKMLG
jgi:L-2-hydroxyglutarate oxidase LhgO